MKLIKLTQITKKYSYVDREKDGNKYSTRESTDVKSPVWVNPERINYMELNSEGRTVITFLDTYEASCCVTVIENPEEIMARFT